MTAEMDLAAVDPARFRHVLGHLPSGVVVVSAMSDGEPVGLTVGSFTSVSLSPPLVGFFPSKNSSSWPRIHRAGTFAVNVLGDHQEHIGRSFAGSAANKFAGHTWRPGSNQAPIIDGVPAWIECETVSVTDAGDHWFVLGRVLALDVVDGRRPLLYFRGRYARLGD
jgi:flavin reductase (DIM6/NTAB) family NADH-FMN oxidoreductase RutF